MKFAREHIKKFQREVKDYYRAHGRRMPWRETSNPYEIVVSEIMLQQTQVSRVLVKYPEYIRIFPNFEALARAPLPKILAVWQGMGYNRRAKALKAFAEIIVRDYNGELPRDPRLLEKFPGIGPATAGSIAAFAFNTPVPFIETNIRRVFIHFFFKRRKSSADGIRDEEILPLILETMDRKNAREWYYALMDYGAMLAQTHRGKNPNIKSARYRKQPKFEGSDRQIRGKIIKLLLQKKSLNAKQIEAMLAREKERVVRILNNLAKEGFLARARGKYSLV